MLGDEREAALLTRLSIYIIPGHLDRRRAASRTKRQGEENKFMELIKKIYFVEAKGRRAEEEKKRLVPLLLQFGGGWAVHPKEE